MHIHIHSPLSPLSRLVMQMKFKFAVIYVVVVHLLSVMISFFIRITKDDAMRGMMRETYEEQEMLYRFARF